MNESNDNGYDDSSSVSFSEESNDVIYTDVMRVDGQNPPNKTNPSMHLMEATDYDGDDNIFLYKQKRINYFKKFYLRQCIFSVNSFKNWIYLGCMDDTCYIYNNLLDDLTCFFNLNCKDKDPNNTDAAGVATRVGLKNVVKLKTLKNQKFTDTILGVKFSCNYKYVGIGVYDGSVHVYENNDFSGGTILDYTLPEKKKNLNESNTLMKICNWDHIFLKDKNENIKKTCFGSNPTKSSTYARKSILSRFINSSYLNETMSLISTLDMKEIEGDYDLQDFMFCPFNETILLSIYEKKQNVYVWDILQNSIINIIHTTECPTFLNICNYGSEKHLFVGFYGGQSSVYKYDVFNIKLQEDERKWKKNKDPTKSRILLKTNMEADNVNNMDMHDLDPKRSDTQLEMSVGAMAGGKKKSYGNAPSIMVQQEYYKRGIINCSGTNSTSDTIINNNNNINNSNLIDAPNKYESTENTSEERLVEGVLCIDNSISHPVYATTYNTNITLRTVNGNSILDTLRIHNECVEFCLFNNKSSNIIASCSLDNIVNMYDIEHHSLINQFAVTYEFEKEDTFAEMETGLNYLRWVNSNLLLFASLNGNLYFYDIRERKCVKQIMSHTGTIYNVDLGMHVYQEKYILSALTSGVDGSANLHFLDMTGSL